MWPSIGTASRIPDSAPCIRSPLLLLVLLWSVSACVTDERAVRVEKGPPLEFALEDAKTVDRKLRQSGFQEITTILDRQAKG